MLAKDARGQLGAGCWREVTIPPQRTLHRLLESPHGMMSDSLRQDGNGYSFDDLALESQFES